MAGCHNDYHRTVLHTAILLVARTVLYYSGMTNWNTKSLTEDEVIYIFKAAVNNKCGIKVWDGVKLFCEYESVMDGDRVSCDVFDAVMHFAKNGLTVTH